jgi:hypothetical protein
MAEVGTVVKEETAKQAIILAFSIVAVAATAWVMQELSDPDVFKTLRMKMALEAKHYWQERADKFQKRADDAATAYNKEKW